MSAEKNVQETVIWLKLGKHFVNEKNVRSVSRHGKQTRISLINGEDIIVEMDYDKVSDLVGKKD